jgi:hypothetical protein
MKYTKIIFILFILLVLVIYNNGCDQFSGLLSSSSTIGKTETDPNRELDFSYHQTRENMFSSLKEIRMLSNLRELAPREHGKSVSELPSGTYFFLSPYNLVTNTKDTTRFWSRSIVSKDPQFIVDYYEVHYVSAKKIDLIAYVTEKDATKLHQLDGYSKQKVTLAPSPFDEKTNTLVSLPYYRILEAEVHITRSDDGEDMYLLDSVVQ